MREVQFKDLTETQQKLVNEAEKILLHSYSPYSGFAVGAALLTGDGTIITGTNFENSSYPATICAERSALTRANIMGYRNFSSIALICRKDKPDPDQVISPCGICRQSLIEASVVSKCNIEILMVSSDKKRVFISSIEELLPFAFGPKDLE